TLLVIVYDTINQSTVQQILFIVENFSTEEVVLKNRYLLTVNNDDKNDVIDFTNKVEWVKIYDTRGNLVYETKSKIEKSNLKFGYYIYKAKLKNGKIQIGSLVVIK
ncbi:MAG: hypothetical protein N2505_06810, partial [Endomicrobia bacterium]|nr:hypothetical protein [Endomicrobiia bacterium]